MIIVFLLIFPLFVLSQGNGIVFRKGLSWQQVKEAAKIGNKFIFLDCYATWCNPCKMMDKKIYVDDGVGRLMNQEFISVKVQMDVTPDDADDIKSWYNDAKKIIQQYNITIYPTFLFFNSDGILVHKGLGYQSIDAFRTIVEDSKTEEKQYFTLLNKYEQGILSLEKVKELALSAKRLQDNEQAEKIANEYIINYLFKQSISELQKKENQQFILDMTFFVKDPGFQYIQQHSDEIDKMLGKNIAEHKLIKCIISTEIDPKLSHVRKGKNYGWGRLYKKLKRNYGSLGCIATLQRQLTYFLEVKNWLEFANAYKLYYEQVGGLNIFNINNLTWEIFNHINDKATLTYAIKVMEAHKNENVESMDTYANLLYKMGDRDKAIEWEQKAIKLDEEIAISKNLPSDATFQRTKEKMESNQPTWEIK